MGLTSCAAFINSKQYGQKTDLYKFTYFSILNFQARFSLEQSGYSNGISTSIPKYIVHVLSTYYILSSVPVMR